MARKLDPKTKKITELTELLDRAKRDTSYERGRSEEVREQLNSKEDRIDKLIYQLERNTQTMVQEIHWMRQLVELLCVPKEKLEELQKIREQDMQPSPDDFTRRRY